MFIRLSLGFFCCKNSSCCFDLVKKLQQKLLRSLNCNEALFLETHCQFSKTVVCQIPDTDPGANTRYLPGTDLSGTDTDTETSLKVRKINFKPPVKELEAEKYIGTICRNAISKTFSGKWYTLETHLASGNHITCARKDDPSGEVAVEEEEEDPRRRKVVITGSKLLNRLSGTSNPHPITPLINPDQVIEINFCFSRFILENTLDIRQIHRKK